MFKNVSVGTDVVSKLDVLKKGSGGESYNSIIEALIENYMEHNTDESIFEAIARIAIKEGIEHIERKTKTKIKESDRRVIVFLIQKKRKNAVAVLFNEHPELREQFL